MTKKTENQGCDSTKTPVRGELKPNRKGGQHDQ